MSVAFKQSSVLAALALAVACGGAKTDRPVATTTGDSTTTSPAGTTAAKQGKSMVRLVNAVPGRGTLDVSGDDQSLFSTTAFKSVSPYLEVKDNMMTFRVRTSGKDSVLVDNRETMMDGYRYTIVTYPGDSGSTRVRVLRDELKPDSGKARIRVINAGSGSGPVNVHLRGTDEALFTNVAEGVEAGYKDIAPTTGTVEIRSTTSKHAPLVLVKQEFQAGHSYTMVITGKGATKADLISFEDAEFGARITPPN